MFNPRMPVPAVQPRAKEGTIVPREATAPGQETDASTTWLNAQDQTDILSGAAFLSAGGGGAKSLGQKLLKVMNSPVPMVGVESVPDDAYVVCSAYIGSPSAAARLNSPTFNSLERAVQALEAAAGVRGSYVVPGEMGAVNSIAPMLAANDLKRRVVDADGCGRAVPLISATTFGVQPALARLGAATANEADETSQEQSAVLSAGTTGELQGGVGALIGSPSYGMLGAAALWLMTGSQLKEFAVPSGLSRARGIGAALRAASGNYTSVVLNQLSSFGMPGRVLFEGSLLKPVKFIQHTQDAHDIGVLVLERADGKGSATVFTLNENILAYSSDQSAPVIQMPDMLCWLGEDGSTFDNAQLQSEVNNGAARPIYAIGVEATQTVGTPPSGITFRDYQGIRAQMAAIMGAVGYAGAYVPFDSKGQ